jgi:hypothetical protein
VKNSPKLSISKLLCNDFRGKKNPLQKFTDYQGNRLSMVLMTQRLAAELEVMVWGSNRNSKLECPTT